MSPFKVHYSLDCAGSFTSNIAFTLCTYLLTSTETRHSAGRFALNKNKFDQLTVRFARRNGNDDTTTVPQILTSTTGVLL